MADTIITRIQVEGGQAYVTEMQQASKSIDTLDKSQRILAQSTQGLSETQLQLVEKIRATKKALDDNKNADVATALSKEQLQQNLSKLVNEYDKTTREIAKNSNEVKKATLDSSNYSKVLDQVASGEVSVREATRLLNQEYIKLKLQGKENTDQMRQLRQVSGELKDTVGDASQEIATAGSDTRGLDKTVRAITAVSAGFQVAEGVSALFGGENKKLQETLIRLNAVMAITNGLQQVGQELTRKDSILYPIVTKFQKLWTLAIGETAGAMRILRVALASIGIGLIIAGIIELIKYTDKWINATVKVNEAKKIYNQTAKTAQQNISNERSEIIGLIAILKDENTTREQKNAALNKLRAQYPEYLSKLTLENIKTKEGNDLITQQIALLARREQIKTLTKEIADLETQIALKPDIDLTFGDKLEILANKLYTGFDARANVTNKRLEKQTEELKKQRDVRIELLHQLLTSETADALISNDKNKEVGEKVGKEVGKGITDGIEVETRGSIEILESQISALEKAIKDIILEDLQLGVQPSEAVKVLIQQLQELKEQLAQVNAEFEAMQTNGTEIEGGIKRVTATGEESTKQLGATVDTTLKGSKTHLESVLENAENVQDKLSPILNTFNELTQFASEIISQRAEKEITQLDRQKEEGLISERKYQREVAKIKTDAARKQRRVEVAQAYAQIPIAILSAFIGTPGGIIIKSIAAAIAGGIALAQAIKLQSAPLPQFRHGVINLQRGNNPRGVDTIPAMLNEGESVMTTEETKKHMKALTAMRKGTFDKEFFNVAKLAKVVPIINYNATQPKQSEARQKDIDISPIVEELEYIGHYIKDGNGEARQRTGQLIRIAESLKSKRYA